MRLTYGQLRLWRADVLRECARSVAANQRRLEALASPLAVNPRGGGCWDGEAAEAAAARHTELRGEHTRIVSAVTATASALDRAAEQVAAIAGLVELADEVAGTHGLAITDFGEVVEVPGWPVPTDPIAAQQLSLTRERARWEVRDDVEQLIARAGEVDASLHASLGAALSGAVAASGGRAPGPLSLSPGGGGAAGPRSVPPGLGGPGWTPWDSAAWWMLLTPSERDAVIAEHPERVGPTDGVPAWARDRANRVLLDRAEVSLVGVQQRLQTLIEPALPLLPTLALLPTLPLLPLLPLVAARTAKAAASSRVEAQLAAVRAIKSVLSQQDGRTRQLLLVDPSGRLVTAAVTVGDLDRAGHVAVFVGGLTTSVEGDIRRYDATMGEMSDLARRQSRASGDGRDVAAVTWMGYEAPQWDDITEPDRSVLLPRAAQVGAPHLAAFVNGLDASRGAPSNQAQLTIWAHSYGSPTAGLALAGANTGVDDLVAFGSPGLGVSDLPALHLPPGRVHVLEAGDDVVADLGRFGPDPDEMPGADVLSTAATMLPDGSGGAASSGHSEYLKPGSTSAWNLAAVAAGTPQLLVRRPRCAEPASPLGAAVTRPRTPACPRPAAR